MWVSVNAARAVTFVRRRFSRRRALTGSPLEHGPQARHQHDGLPAPGLLGLGGGAPAAEAAHACGHMQHGGESSAGGPAQRRRAAAALTAASSAATVLSTLWRPPSPHLGKRRLGGWEGGRGRDRFRLAPALKSALQRVWALRRGGWGMWRARDGARVWALGPGLGTGLPLAALSELGRSCLAVDGAAVMDECRAGRRRWPRGCVRAAPGLQRQRLTCRGSQCPLSTSILGPAFSGTPPGFHVNACRGSCCG